MLLLVQPHLQCYRAVLRKLIRIGQQVYDHLLHTLDVRMELQTFQRTFKQEPVGRPARLCHRGQSLRTNLHHITLFLRKGHPVHLQPGKVQNIINQPEQQVRIRLDNLKKSPLLLQRNIAGREHIRKSHNSIQRCAYLMTHIGKECTLQAVCLLRPLLRLTQGCLGDFQFVFQFLRVIVEIERDEQSHQQAEQNGCYPPYMIFVLLIERRSYIYQFHRSGK